jgi:protein-S-isoprenylcysteine O-methyltransferase Ste14
MLAAWRTDARRRERCVNRIPLPWGMADAPAYRIWPPVGLGLQLLVGLGLSASVGDPIQLPVTTSRDAAVVLLVAFAVWNTWALGLMARHRTALLPGGSTRTILDRGPFGVSRNPLYLGLIALDGGLALLVPSFWALASVPVGVVALWWGAILPEERYLGAKFGAEYADYRARVRRWL